jgi:hypothetical protein
VSSVVSVVAVPGLRVKRIVKKRREVAMMVVEKRMKFFMMCVGK